GCQKVAGGRSPRRPPEKVISHDRTPKGCQTSGQRKFTAKDLAPLRGATQLISRIPGGLRGLRPPATFFATLRVAEVSQLHSYPLMGLLKLTPFSTPGVNPWATEKSFKLGRYQSPAVLKMKQTRQSALHLNVGRCPWARRLRPVLHHQPAFPVWQLR